MSTSRLEPDIARQRAARQAAVKPTSTLDLQRQLTESRNKLEIAKRDLTRLRTSQAKSKQKTSKLEQIKSDLISERKKIAKVKQTTTRQTAKPKYPQGYQPRRVELKTIFNKIQGQADKYYNASGLERTTKPTKADVKTYYELTGYKAVNPPKNLNEAKNRLAYMGAHITLGALREETLPFSWAIGRPRNYQEAILQTTGGLLVPSPADLATGLVLQKLSLTKRGRKLLDDLASALKKNDKAEIEKIREAIQFAKLQPPDTYNRQLDPVEVRKAVEQILDEYAKANSKALGGMAAPQELIELNQLAPQYFDETFNKFKNDGSAVLDINNPFAALAIGSKLDSRTQQILASDEIEQLRELNSQIQETKQVEKQLDTTEQTMDKAIKTLEGEKGEEGYKGVIEETQRVIPKQTQREVSETVEETVEEPELVKTPKLKLSPKELKQRDKINLQLYRGASKLYKVKYDHGGTVGPIEARGLIPALSIAQRRRLSTKKRPTDITITLVGEKR